MNGAMWHQFLVSKSFICALLLVNCVYLGGGKLNRLSNYFGDNALEVLNALFHVIYSLLRRDYQFAKAVAEAVADLIVELLVFSLNVVLLGHLGSLALFCFVLLVFAIVTQSFFGLLLGLNNVVFLLYHLHIFLLAMWIHYTVFVWWGDRLL